VVGAVWVGRYSVPTQLGSRAGGRSALGNWSPVSLDLGSAMVCRKGCEGGGRARGVKGD